MADNWENVPAIMDHVSMAKSKDPLREMLLLYHEAARSIDGVLMLTIIDRNGRVRCQKFEIGAVEEMSGAALARSDRDNVFFAPTVLRRDIRSGQRGNYDDIVAVLAVVIDDDKDTGNVAVLPPGILPSVELTTSRLPTQNRQHHFVFTKPLPPEEARLLAQLLHRKCAGDSGTSDVAHVWRLPNTLNHPTHAKISRGRPTEPQRVELTGGNFERIDPEKLRQALEAMPDGKVRNIANTSPAVSSTNTESIAMGLPPVPPWLRALLKQSTGVQGDRSSHCHRCMQLLMEHGLSDDDIRQSAVTSPFAVKYVERGDLEAEIGRAREKWIASGSKRAGIASSDSIDIIPWPDLSASATYGLAGEIAQLATRSSEADPVAVLASALTWGAAIFGRQRSMMVGDGTHHARLFSALVGASSRSRKGTSLDPVSRIFKEVERLLQADSTLPSSSLKLSYGPLSTGEGLIACIRDKRGDDDVDGIEDKRLLCIENELGGTLRSAQRLGNTLSAVVRNAWDGSTLQPLTKRDRICATDPHVCILGHITRHELKELLKNSDLHNGFANRFLWIAVRRRGLVPFPLPMPEDDVIRMGAELSRIVRHAHTPMKISLSNAAVDRWKNCYPTLSADHTGLLGAVTSRAEAQTLRLALTYALFDGADCIDLAHLEAALALWQYSFESSELIFGTTLHNSVAQKILEELSVHPLSQSEISALFNHNLDKYRISQALSELQEAGRIGSKTELTGGRPRSVWTLV